MHTEFRILEVRRGHVWAQPLDAAKRETLRIARSSKYIENKVIVAEPLSVGPGAPPRWKVIASRVDPSFIGGELPKLAPFATKNEENEWLRKESRDFLRRLTATKPFVQRLDRAIELKAALDSHDSLPPGEMRSAKVTELFALFDDDQIPKILEECRAAL